MLARARNSGPLVVTFCRHGDGDDQEATASTGKHALQIVRRMLAECDELHAGDLISIWRRRRATKPYSMRGDLFSIWRRVPFAKRRSRSVRQTDG